MRVRDLASVAVLVVVVSACGADVGGSSTSAEPLPTSSTIDGPTTTSTSVDTETPTSQPDTASGDATVHPEVARDDLDGASSTFVDADGRMVSTVTPDGDYVLVDHATGLPVVSYNARSLDMWVDIGVSRAGTISHDDPFLRLQTAAQGIVAAARESGTAESVTIEGREAAQATHREEYTFDEWTVVTDYTVAVDVETGLLVRYDVVQISPEPIPEEEPRKTVPGDVTTGTSVDEDMFKAYGSTDQTFDDGFVLAGTLEEAATLAGYRLLVPSWLPEGFVLTQIAFGDEPAGLVDRQKMVVLTYRNWAWRIDVTMRSAGDFDEWDDPLDPEGRLQSIGTVRNFELRAGDVNAPPHAWAVVDDQIVTVSGSIGPQTLKTIVESLERIP